VEEFEIAFISGRSRFQTPVDMFLKSEKKKKKERDRSGVEPW
jgi:hypothetical protein